VLLRVLPFFAAAILFASALALRESPSTAPAQEPGERYSKKRSSCGPDVGVWARDLGLARTRELTLCLLNERRLRHGLPALRSEARLQVAAQRYAQDMVERRFFAHDDPGGLDPQDRILMAGYPALRASTGENLAWGTGPEGSPVEIVDGWMHSPGHRENVLRETFAEIGIGVAFDIPEEREDVEPGATYATSFGGT
jgi:hypothetical protein